MALFRKVTSTAREMLDARTWGATDDPFVEIEFEHEGATGRLTKRFAGQKGTVELEIDGQTITDPGQVDTIVAEMTGLPSEKFLRSTASVRHQELEDLDRTRARSGTGSSSPSAAPTGAPTPPAACWVTRSAGIARRASATRAWCARHGRSSSGCAWSSPRARSRWPRLEADRNALALAHDRRSQLDARLTRDQEALDAGERAVRLETSATDAEARYMRLRQAVDLQARITQGERDHPSSTPLPALKEGVRRLKDLQFQIQELESDLELQPDLSAAAGRRTSSHPAGGRSALLAIVILVGAAGGPWASAAATTILPTVVGLGIAVALLVVGIGLGVWALRRYREAATCGARWSSTRPISSAGCGAGPRRRSSCAAARREKRRAAHLAGRGRCLCRRRAAGPGGRARRGHRGAAGRDAGRPGRGAGERRPGRRARPGRGRDGPVATRPRGAGRCGPGSRRGPGAGAADAPPDAAGREVAIQEEGQAQGRVDQNSIDAERVAALAESVDATEERLDGLERRARIYELTLAAHRPRGAGDHEEGRALPRGAHGRRCRPHHRRALPAGRRSTSRT